MMFVADRPPAEIEEIDERLRSRFEGGLLLELEDGEIRPFQVLEVETEVVEEARFVPGLAEDDEAVDEDHASSPQASPVEPAPKKGGVWFPGPENVVIHWPRFEDLLIEELD